MGLHLRLGNSGLLVLLAFLLNVILCSSWSLPQMTTLSTDECDEHAPLTYAEFMKDLHTRGTVQVSQSPHDQAKFLKFDRSPSMMGSDGFAGSIGLLIGGDDGAILAHYSNTTRDLRIAKETLPSLIRNHTRALKNPRAFLFAEINPKTNTWESDYFNYELEDIVHETLGIEPTPVMYIQPEKLVDLKKDYSAYCRLEIMYGGILLKYPGQGKGGWVGYFIDSVLQKAVFEGTHAY